MRNNKQSSIEWLAQQLYEQMEMCGDGNVYDKIIKQAKLLHKQEIVDAYYGELYYESTSNGEHYYNETFGGDNNGEITTNNIPGINTNTTGNISNTWAGDRTSTTGNIDEWGNINAWSGGHIKNGTIISDRTGTKTEDDNRIKAEKQIWDRTVNWDIMNKYTHRVRDEEQALYNKTIVLKDGEMGTTRVIKPDETNDGTLAVIEITVKVRSN